VLWDGVVPLLAQRFRVLRFDNRGVGLSSTPKPVSAYTMARMADDFAAVIGELSPGQPVHVLAHDWGSVQLWEAVCEPGAEQRIASFTSISGPNLDHLGAWVRRSLTEPTPQRLGAVLVQGLSSSYVGVFVSPAAPFLLRNLGDLDRWTEFLRRTEGFEPPPEAIADTLVDDMVNGLRYYRANVRLRPRRPRERRTSVPVLLLVPTHDRAVRASSFEETERWVPNLERVDVPYGHWVAMAAPEVVADETTRFIRSLPPRPAA
jgi:pimeloyl-ACP methyl ester carboxylesterase